MSKRTANKKIYFTKSFQFREIVPSSISAVFLLSILHATRRLVFSKISRKVDAEDLGTTLVDREKFSMLRIKLYGM